MATIRAAVLFGGRLGKSVTVDTTTDYVTLTYHGLRNGKGIAFKSGALPDVTGDALALDTVYYAKNISLNTFELYRDLALTTKIDFVTTGSSLVVYSAMWLSMSAGNRLRYGMAGSERVFDSVTAAATYFLTGNITDVNVIEILQAFDDVSVNYTLYNNSQSLKITTFVDKTPTEAFHGGVKGGGYTLTSYTSSNTLRPSSMFIEVEGLEIVGPTTNSQPAVFQAASVMVLTKNIIRHPYGGNGVYIAGPCEITNNIIIDCTHTTDGYGLYVSPNSKGVFIANNLVTNCKTGIRCFSATALVCFNNLIIGNTVNWGANQTALESIMGSNLGSEQDNNTFTISSSNFVCVNTPNFVANQAITLRTTGVLPASGGVPLRTDIVYYVNSVATKTVTLKFNRADPSAMVLSNSGSGVHAICGVWESSAPPPTFIDFTTPNNAFVSWSGLDFRPAGYGTSTPGSQALMVDAAGAVPRLSLTEDILGKERPGYKNGSPEYSDIGPYEFDFGYGPRPATATVTFSGVNAGSEIRVYNSTGTELNGIESCDANQVLSWAVPAVVTVTVRVVHPDYKIKEFDFTTTAGASNLPIQQEVDKWYSNPA